MTTPITTSTTDSQMHNNIMAAGSRDRPPMLATGRYAQWQSRFLRYIDTRPNGDALRKCILEAVLERTAVETILTMSPKNKAHYESEKEAIHLLLTGIGDEIYSTIDACKTAHEMWIAIKRLQQAPKSHKSYAPPSKQSSSTRSNASTKFKGKEIAKPITPPSESASEEDSDLEQAQRDKDMQKNFSLIAKYFKKIYKPTNNNLRTSSNSRTKNVDITPRNKNKNQTGQFRNQRTMTVAEARETVRIQEVPTADSGTDTEPLEHVHNDAEYNVFANVRQHSEQPESTSNTCLMEKDDSNVTPDSSDMCDNDIQTDQNVEDERAALANLIVNLKLDVDENKKIQNQLKKENASLAHELKECKSILAKTSKTLGESNSIRDICLVALQNKQTKFERTISSKRH
ncbi:hypothetical protein Tco_1269660 [Tanacetum coccineum]